MTELLNPPQASADQVASKLREYEMHKANGDTDLAQKAWREYWDLCGLEIERKRTERAA